MSTLPNATTSELWAMLSWTLSHFTVSSNKGQPLDIPEASATGGLYRMTWVGREEWPLIAAAKRQVAASAKVDGPQLQLGELTPPVWLTIGRTTGIRKRLRQHFGTNTNNNRMIQRLGNLLPGRNYSELCNLVVRNISVEWVEVPSWIERCLLEHYGLALLRPIFDLDAEH